MNAIVIRIELPRHFIAPVVALESTPPAPPRFLIDDETVLDTSTGLMWQRATSAARLPWSAAKKAAAACRASGHADWRLPTIQELLSLVDYTRHEPAIDTQAFPGTQSAAYWSSSPAAWAPADVAWIVDFYDGYAYYYYQGYDAFVRAVRSAAPASQ